MSDEVKQEMPTDTQIDDVNAKDIEAPASESTEVERPNEKDSGETSIDVLPLPEADEEEKDSPKNKDFIIKRKENQLAREREKSERLAAELEETRRNRQEGVPSTYYDPGLSAPQREDFGTEDEWLDAKLDYRDRVKQIKYARDAQDRAFKSEYEDYKKSYESTMDLGASKYSDFDDVISPIMAPGFPTNDALAKAIFKSEFGSDILYFFGKNKEEARKIAEKNPIDAIKKVAEIEARFREKRSAKKTTSSTYKPMQSVSSGGSSGISADAISKMPQKEFEEFYKKTFKPKGF